MGFLLKKYVVGVVGYGDANFFAANKKQARMRAFRAMQSANDAITFKRFLEQLSFIEEVPAHKGFGRAILVDGKPAHWVAHDGGNCVQFVWPDETTIWISHEADVCEVAQ